MSPSDVTPAELVRVLATVMLTAVAGVFAATVPSMLSGTDADAHAAPVLDIDLGSAPPLSSTRPIAPPPSAG